MSKQDLNYIDLLNENRNAPPEVLHAYIDEFWSSTSLDHLSGPTFRAKYLGAIPSRLPAGWFESPEIAIQRVGLYTDTLLFVDIVGRILENRSKAISDEELNSQLTRAIRTMIELRPAARENVVGFLPTDKYLPPLSSNTSIADV